ncbi:hypothetical protein FHX49_000114 [Microbacterium endophyticum]|uniref:Signal transduction histidine kinase subgroup 3 dimerisation and phosphoacceptor domain-containing protein n=1 Tax=Microbacterium endophyticum TaxID=1526412 RepID=A0A7W4YKX6_9MICO|nr:histidine kinase [Microbacterium endophyticum]MBB2974573.1 hypothetical protein [Microbacterium endophyticum]NIK36870.1 hypothetical protein [Microbacterium endophyticum]
MTITDSRQHSQAAAPLPKNEYRLSFGHVVRSEWTKFTTVRSTGWSIGLVTVVSVGLSMLMASAIASFGGDEAASVTASNVTAVQAIVFSTVLTQLLAVILGAISVTGEYSTGMIRSTQTAAPGRFGSLLAKSLVVGTTMFITGIVAFAVSVAVTTPILGKAALDFSDTSSSLMPLLGGAFYLALISILGVGIGFMVRNGPGALAIGIGLVFVAPILFLFFPRTDSFAWVQTIASYAPSNAGQSLFMGGGMSGNPLETWPAILTLVAWALVAIVGGAAVLRAHDAYSHAVSNSRVFVLGGAHSITEDELRLPRPPGMVRRFWARHPFFTDILIAILTLFVSALGTRVSDGMSTEPDALTLTASIVLMIAGCVALIWRRRWPTIVFTVSVLPLLLIGGGGVELLGPAAVVSIYSIAVYRSARACWYSFGAAIVLFVVVTWLSLAMAHADLMPAVNVNLSATFLLLLGALIGINVGNRKRYLEALIDRSRQLLIERDQHSRLATAAERTRIAREMHDIVSHSLTAIVALSEGASVTKDHERAAEASRTVAKRSR